MGHPETPSAAAGPQGESRFARKPLQRAPRVAGNAPSPVVGQGASHQTAWPLSIKDDNRPSTLFTTPKTPPAPLYTAAQRARRDATRWTLVQGILAPIQFLIFLVSLALVLRWLGTGRGLGIATGSVVVKTLALYAIMITGSIWEKVVFGRYCSLARSSGRTCSRCWCWRCTRPISSHSVRPGALQPHAADGCSRSPPTASYVDQRHAVHPEAARRTSRTPPVLDTAAAIPIGAAT